MTTLQKAMIKKIATSDYSPTNGRPPKTFEETGATWADDIIEDSEDKGVVTSLINAGMVEVMTYRNKRDNTIELTEKGFEEFLKIA